MSSAATESYQFEADIKQLLDIVVHSLYAEKEIFVRELISNASDALERLRHLQLTEQDGLEADVPLEIEIATDEAANTITIRDSGVGMTRRELVENLGTIAHSGSKAFAQALAERAQPAQSPGALIGQFGVGFYSAFMVAKRVMVSTRSWRPDESGCVWTSDGGGTYEIADAADLRRGTTVVVSLAEEHAEFAREWRVRELLERYSAFVSFPITLNGSRVNTVQALWLRRPSEPSGEEYAEFYKFLTHAYDEPRLRLHFSTDAPLSVNALLFVPAENGERLGLGRTEPSVALYSRRVLIDAHPKDLLPGWLRFLKGVVDSEDAPLNVARETMQDRSLMARLRSVLTVRVLRFLDEEATQRPEAYATFYGAFGSFVKEGAALELAHRDALAKLLRFESSATENGRLTSFAEYVSRMPDDQSEIYYLIGPKRSAIERGPYLEGFRARGLEVLYCHQPVDELVMSNLHAFGGKTIVAADHANLTLAPQTDAPDALGADETAALIGWLRTTLDQRVVDVTASARLVDSPALVVAADPMMSPHMRLMMKAMHRQGADAPARVRFEINPRHPVIKRLADKRTTDVERATLVAEQILDNALLGAGLLDDPTAMVSRLNRLLEVV